MGILDLVTKKKPAKAETTDEYDARRATELAKEKEAIDKKYTIPQVQEPNEYRRTPSGRYEGLQLEKGQIPRVEKGLKDAE